MDNRAFPLFPKGKGAQSFGEGSGESPKIPKTQAFRPKRFPKRREPKGVSHILHRLWIPGCGKPEILDSCGLRWKTPRKFSTFSTSFPQLWGKRWTSSFWLSFHKGLRRQTPPPSIHAKRIPSNYTAKIHRRKLENYNGAWFARGKLLCQKPLSRSPRKAAKMKGICGRRLLSQKSPPTPTRKPAENSVACKCAPEGVQRARGFDPLKPSGSNTNEKKL